MNKDLRVLVKQAEQQGFLTEPCKRGRIIRNPETQETAMVPDSANGFRVLSNARKNLENIGFQDPRRPHTRKRPRDTKDQPHMAQPATTAANPAASAITQIIADKATSVWTVSERLLELATESGRPYDLDRGDRRTFRKWSGDIKTLVFHHLWPGLQEADEEQWRNLTAALAADLRQAGIIAGREKDGRSYWYVAEPKPEAEAKPAPRPPVTDPFQTPAPNPTRPAAPPPRPAPTPASTAVRSTAPPAPRPAADPAARPAPPARNTNTQAAAFPMPDTRSQRAPKGFPCSECCYVGDSAQALGSHTARAAGHKEERGAPFLCRDVLASINVESDCVLEAPTVESLINHLRRRHANYVDGLQFCHVTTCLAAFPKEQRVADHNAEFHGGRGKKGSKGTEPKGAAAPVPAASTAPAGTDRVLTPTVPPRRTGAPAPVGGMDPSAVVEAITTMAEQSQRAMAENAALREQVAALTAERDELRRQLASGAEARAKVEELEETVARLQREAEAFEQIRSGLAHLMGGQQG